MISYKNDKSYLPLNTNKIEGVRLMVFNTTFNTISVISWRSVLLVEVIEIEKNLVQYINTTMYEITGMFKFLHLKQTSFTKHVYSVPTVF
jgi:hypothetical protein